MVRCHCQRTLVKHPHCNTANYGHNALVYELFIGVPGRLKNPNGDKATNGNSTLVNELLICAHGTEQRPCAIAADTAASFALTKARTAAVSPRLSATQPSVVRCSCQRMIDNRKIMVSARDDSNPANILIIIENARKCAVTCVEAADFAAFFVVTGICPPMLVIGG